MSNKNTFLPGDILLPKSDFEKWAVVACDQYTSEPEYWQKTEEIVGDAPSALRIVLPEAYLGKNDDKHIADINATMADYIKNGVFETLENTFIYIERECLDQKIRHGLVGLIDLEDYDYKKGSSALIRATEETVLERIPPRVKIRKDAPLELPHVMLLIDDPNGTVIEPLSTKTDAFSKVYDFELMHGSGHIKGFKLDEQTSANIQSALNQLAETDDNGLLFAVGDGNHSLATAKECYNRSGDLAARYALVEVVNIHDASLEFEPIYRVVFGVNPEEMLNDFVSTLGGNYHGDDAQTFTCIYGNTERVVKVKPTSKLAVGTLQTYLNDYLEKNKDAKVDYIHGEDVVKALAAKDNTLGFIFDGMRKDELFDAVRLDGSLPRKTFSMGHASDKRFYIEARKIKTI